MEPEQRQFILLIGFMVLLATTILFVFVYAPNPLEAYYPEIPSFRELGRFLLENFNIFNYL